MTYYAKLHPYGLEYVDPERPTRLTRQYSKTTEEEALTLEELGIYPVEIVEENGIDHIEDGVIKHYIGKPLTEEEKKIQKLSRSLNNVRDLIPALEKIIALYGVTEEDKNSANSRIALRDELGKLIQTEEGDGSDMNPYKWVNGKSVQTGKWYQTPGDYIWEAIKDGIPANETDTEYFDVVGL